MLSFTAWLRWLWRQLTSMRIALFLLFLLALASVPGSIFPQRGTAPARVSQYLRDNPKSGLILDRLHMFDVFASPWFAAIYLLLFISLAGCVIPRLFEYWKELRSEPPAAPKNLSRLGVYQTWHSEVSAELALPDTSSSWAKKGWRVRTAADHVSAERGYAREFGNLLFHFALLGLLVAVGVGSSYGFRGTVIVREGYGFANNVTQYDSFTPGRAYSVNELAPFSFSLIKFHASYQVGGMQSGAAREFHADVSVKSSPTASSKKVRIEVNEPLRVSGVTVYLVGHGYSPEFTVRDSKGDVVWKDAAIFLPQDANFTSNGVVKAPDSVPQLGLQGYFLPTVTTDFSMGPRSIFPAADDPKVYLSAWQGDLGLDNGIPQSVYQLDTTKMKRIGTEELAPGQKWVLPKGQGTVEFTGFRQWAAFSLAHDPGKGWALLFAILAIAGLTMSLLIPRRRVWLRITESQDGGNLYEVGGLAKTQAPGLPADVAKLAQLALEIAPEVTRD